MSFSLSLLLLKPEQKSEQCTWWHAETVLNIGRVSAPGLARNARGRAAFHFVTTFFEQEVNKYVRRMGKQCFAPPFACFEDPFQTIPGKTYQFIEPGSCNIAAWDTADHNQSLSTATGYGPKDDLVFTLPLAWIPCSLLAEWISKGEQRPSILKLHEKDPEALAYFSMWKSCLIEMGKIGCNALFLFENLRNPDWI